MVEKKYKYSIFLHSVSMLAFVLASPSYANPEGGVVASGSAIINASGAKMDIHQHTNKAVIDWRGFDIAPHEHTQFHQPSADATVLNRVNSADPSHIAGTLSGNGNVVLVNPNGVFFDRTSQVDVNGLIATTADISTQDFMAGEVTFTKPGNPDAKIINHGSITAKDAGLVGLVAPHVENHGVIRATMGKVHLASGDGFAVDMSGKGLYELSVSDEVASQLVKNTGTITAEGGNITLTAARGKEIVDNLIHVKGELSTPSVSQQGGKIIIAGQGSTVQVSGEVSASGEVKAGEILIGGDVHGSGDIPTAAHTTVTDQAVITANTTHAGDAGKVVIWSDETTHVAGTIEAKHGVAGGSGGFIETSGKQTLNVDSDIAVDTSGGTWLLDPTDITITSAPGANNIAPGTITTALGLNNVVIHTGEDTVGGDSGDITVSEDVSYDSSNTLSLLAHRHINANANIVNDGDGDINLVAGWDDDFGFSPGAAGQQNGLVDMGETGIGILNPANNAYGNNNGSVFVNNAAGTQEVSIASRDGDINVAGYDVTLRGADGGNDRYAQIGHPDDAVATTHVDGNISIDLVNDLTLTAGSGARAHAHVGHGGYYAYTENDIEGDLSGNISINANDVTLFSDHTGADSGYTMIGHGGRRQDGDRTGDIEIYANSLDLDSGGGHFGSYSVVGHGGISSYKTRAGSIIVDVTNDISIDSSGSGSFAYSIIGHGGGDSRSSGTGDIFVRAGGDIGIERGNNSDNYAGIGHIDDSSFSNGDNQDKSGDITVIAGGEISLEHATAARQAYIGHVTNGGVITVSNVKILANAFDFDNSVASGTFDVDNTIFIDRIKNNLTGGDVTLGATGTADMIWNSDLTINDGDDITSNINLLSTRDINFDASVQHGEADLIADGSTTNGLVNVVAGWNWDGANGTGFADASDTTFDVSAITADASSYGNNGGSVVVNSATGSQAVSVGSRDGATTIAARDVTLTGTNSNDEHAQIGYYNASSSGAINVDWLNSLDLTGGSGQRSATLIGHGGFNMDFDQSGDISVETQSPGATITLDGGATAAFAMIGHGGHSADATISGDVRVDTTGAINLNAGDGGAFAAIGHGFEGASGDREGDIFVRGSNIVMEGGGAHAGIGNFGWNTPGDHQGDIDVIATSGDISMTVNSTGSVQIGHGGARSPGSQRGNITVRAANDLSLNHNSANNAHVLIGHGQLSNLRSGSHQGNIIVEAGGEISLYGVPATPNTWIGHHSQDGGHTNANVQISAGALDFDAADTGTFTLSNADFINNLEENLAGGDVALASSNTDMLLASGVDWSSASNNTLSLLGRGDITFSNDVTYNGAGSTLNIASGWDGSSGLNDDGTITFANVLTPNANSVERVLSSGAITATTANIRAGDMVGSRTSPFTITSPTLNLDATSMMYADIDATNVDIGNNSTGVTLTGLVDGGTDQAAADKISGGPGGDARYTFEGFTIRFAPSDSSEEIPVVPTPPVNPQPELPPVDVVTPEPEPESEATPPATRQFSVPKTVQIVSQRGSARGERVGEGAQQVPQQQHKDTSLEKVIILGKDASAAPSKGKVLIHPEVVQQFNISEEDM